MFIDLSALKNNPQFRKLFTGQTISFLGSMMTYVTIPYQAYEITKNSFYVGLISTVQLVPLLLAGLYGGALADSVDRRKLLLYSEFALLLCTLGFVINSLLPNPSFIVLALLTALASAFVGIHRPAMDALIPQIVDKKDLSSVAALGSLRYAIGAVAGPAIGGLLMSSMGATGSYVVDAFTFLISLASLASMTSVAIPKALDKVNLNSILEGLKYATQNPIILGSYLVDIIAMTFAMPIALYPQLADELQQKAKVGLLYASIPLGAAAISLFSKPLENIYRQGAGVILSATCWGVFIVMMSFTHNFYLIALCLFLAGAADSISAIYRSTIWNETIPTHIRGRMGSLNMLSYMVGPLIGNMRAGAMASWSGTHISILSGGILCTLACIACIWLFPQFWSYRKPDHSVIS